MQGCDLSGTDNFDCSGTVDYADFSNAEEKLGWKAAKNVKDYVNQSSSTIEYTY